MKGITQWNANPYVPLDRRADALLPHVVRLAPGETFVELEWLDAGYSGAHTLRYRSYKTDLPWQTAALDGPVARVEGLTADHDYEMQVLRVPPDEGKSAVRVVRTGRVPGKVVNYLHPEDPVYAFSGRSLCSPSLVKLPSGRLIAAMDVFAGGSPQNLSLLFYSDDGGENWRHLTQLFPCFWGKLFTHRGALYMLAHATEYGDVLIGCSRDEGATWTPPVRLFSGSGSNQAAGPHKAPMPVISHAGRLFTGVDCGAWSRGGHASGVLSIDENADLLAPENWELSDFTKYDPAWKGAAVGPSTGTLEGNMVVGPDGGLFNVLRYQMKGCSPAHGKAVMLRADAGHPDRAPVFERFIDMNGGANSKFTLYRDPVSGKYIALANEVVSENTPGQRNVLSLLASDNLTDWRVAKRLHDYSHFEQADVGMQYVDFLIDGENLLYLSRTAMNRARNFHDANYSTFHVLKNFKKYL